MERSFPLPNTGPTPAVIFRGRTWLYFRRHIYSMVNNMHAYLTVSSHLLRLKYTISFLVSFCSSVEICDVFSTDEAKLSVFLKV